MGLDVRSLLPVDTIAALRSFGRRWRGALLPVDDDDVADACLVVGPDGVSALDVVNETIAALASLHRVVDDIARTDRPVVLAEVLDPTRRHFTGLVVDDVDEALDLLAAEATGLADRLGRLLADDWSRVGVRSGSGAEVTILDVAREAVRTAADGLRTAERALR